MGRCVCCSLLCDKESKRTMVEIKGITGPIRVTSYIVICNNTLQAYVYSLKVSLKVKVPDCGLSDHIIS